MASFNKFNAFVEALAEKKHDLGADTLKVMLSNTAPSAANSVKADIVEVAAGNGYTAGGTALAGVTSAQTGGVYTLNANDVTFTASGGAMATFRYLVLYNDTAANDDLIGWWDYGSALSLAATEFLTLDFGASGILQLT